MPIDDDNDSHLNLDDENVSNDEINNDEDIDPVEAEARQMGWRPLDEWQGDKSKWRSATEFVDRASFFKKIEAQNKIISEQNRALKELAKLQSQIAKNEREKVLKELQSQKREALREQEFDRADELDEEIIALRTAPEPDFKVPDVNQVHAEDPNEQLALFKSRNEWFETDPELTQLAETLAGGYVVKLQQEGKPIVPSDIFNYVEKTVKKMTEKSQSSRRPDPVMNSNKTRASSSSGSGKNKFTPSDLSEEQRQVARQLVRSGAFKNEQEYVNEYIKQFGSLD